MEKDTFPLVRLFLSKNVTAEYFNVKVVVKTNHQKTNRLFFFCKCNRRNKQFYGCTYFFSLLVNLEI